MKNTFISAQVIITVGLLVGASQFLGCAGTLSEESAMNALKTTRILSLSGSVASRSATGSVQVIGVGATSGSTPTVGSGTTTPPTPAVGSGSTAPTTPAVGSGSTTPTTPAVGSGSTAPAPSTAGSGSGTEPSATLTLTVVNTCSNRMTNNGQYSVMALVKRGIPVKAVVRNAQSGVSTVISEDLGGIFQSHKQNSISLTVPGSLPSGNYSVAICNPDKCTNLLQGGVPLSWSNGNITSQKNIPGAVLFDNNYRYNNPLGVNNPMCSQVMSPLIVDTAHSVEAANIVLSSPEDGVPFNIVGDGVLHQISWPVQPEKDMFLVLPTSTGKVLGIDQLFGNNTVGPDGLKAENGFEALRKYATADKPNEISAATPIFSKLRLWSDRNRNGVVDAGEFRSLPQMGLTKISLDYVEKEEVDSYGNLTIQRALVQMNGSYAMIFDIWFALGAQN